MTWAVIWGVIAAALVIGEMFTGEFTLLSIAIGCAAAALMAALGLSFPFQTGAALALSVLSVFMLAPWLRRVVAPRHTADPVEAMIGTEAEVIEAINPPEQGKVKLDGVVWQAESDRALAVGARVMVAEVMGARLRVMGSRELLPQRPANAAEATPEADALRLRAQQDESQRLG